MDLTARDWSAALGAAAAAVLAAAFGLEYLGGMRPCHLCLLERWPWAAAAVALVAGAALQRPRWGLVAGLLALLAGTGLGLYHVGVEQGLFALPGTCVAAGTARTVEDLLAQLREAPPPCDQAATLFGISLAVWNVLASAAMAVGCALGLRAGAGPAQALNSTG